ncbi:PIN/TRAM domain-containing protein [Paenibacillus turicensis]|uniref:PIN/TRAM domain-containing protein n=1 Tax=Paenibacillus turicensis TaxID=160487 RepID=UPI003D29600F
MKRNMFFFIGLCGAWFGYSMGGVLTSFPNLLSTWMDGMSGLLQSIVFAVVGALAFLFLFSISAEACNKVISKWVNMLSSIPMNVMVLGGIGLASGILMSFIFYPALSWLGEMSSFVKMATSLLFGYLGLKVCLEKKEEIASLWKSGKWNSDVSEERLLEEHKILDTSVIIDGRIADICKTGFIEGTIVIPQFVLEELQHIADSSDLLKRNRGRRGLDILNRIQKELDIQVLIYEGDFEEISEVDSKLVKLAKLLQGKVVTNDFNLNKVCELQGVSVLNINDLANAVKPVVLPGEEILVQVIKDGKENGQGVAYLDDGTMIVVEGGRDYIGMFTEVLVTSVLQTSAGRMIFAKPKLLEKAQ